MKQVKGFKNSWILTENGLVKTNLLIEDGIKWHGSAPNDEQYAAAVAELTKED